VAVALSRWRKAVLNHALSKDGQGRSNASAWAWGISIGIHIVALCILAAVTLAKAVEDTSADMPQATIGQIKAISESSPITPKPKVKEAPILARTAKSGSKEWSIPVLPQQQRRQTVDAAQNLTALASKTGGRGLTALAMTTDAQNGRTEFFGNYSYDRKICFVVDCSGSMKGLFSQVVAQLRQTIDSLEPDQYFYIIFFGGDNLFEYGGGKMVRASPQAKTTAYNFAKSIKPAGRTDAIRAIRRAFEIKDSAGIKPAVIYFLTDGFELTGAEGQTFCKYVAKLRRNLAPQVKINTIGFWAQEADRPMLETIAAQSGGKCVFINSEK
jgi:hypothetical protein